MKDAIFVTLAAASLIGVAYCGHIIRDSKPKQFNWAIQGVYSQPDCANQPGSHPWYIENSDRSWFMGCR
jgi:hypothetical protein